MSMMKIAITATAALLATSASAEHVYDEIGKDNPDLKEHVPESAQPQTETGAGTEARVYGPIGEDNPDLKREYPTQQRETKDPEVYEKIQPNPDLKY